MLTQQDNLFYQISSKVNNKVYFETLITKQQSYFDIQPFKIEKLYSQIAKKIYNMIRFKQFYIPIKRYQVSKQYLINPTFWYQNQRKIFIWFIVCYFHQQQLNTENNVNFFYLFQVQLNWTLLSSIFFNKNIQFLKFQFKNILKQKHRISWTQQEDNLLIKATQQQGSGCWNEISKNLYFRTSGTIFKSPKHCRQRWLNHLDSSKNKGKWREQQDYLMLVYIRQNGKKWSRISQLLNYTRTQHMVKNRYNSLMTKVRRNKKEKEIETINRVLMGLMGSKMVGGGQEVVGRQQQQNNNKYFIVGNNSKIQNRINNNKTAPVYSSQQQQQQVNNNHLNDNKDEKKKNKNVINNNNSTNHNNQNINNHMIHNHQPNNNQQQQQGQRQQQQQLLLNNNLMKEQNMITNNNKQQQQQHPSSLQSTDLLNISNNTSNTIGFYNFFIQQLPTNTITNNNTIINNNSSMLFFYHLPWLTNQKLNLLPIISTTTHNQSIQTNAKYYKTQPVHILQYNHTI